MTAGEITSTRWRRIRFFWLLADGTLVSDRSRLWEYSTRKRSTVENGIPGRKRDEPLIGSGESRQLKGINRRLLLKELL